jgi:hypothetical protein
MLVLKCAICWLLPSTEVVSRLELQGELFALNRMPDNFKNLNDESPMHLFV